MFFSRSETLFHDDNTFDIAFKPGAHGIAGDTGFGKSLLVAATALGAGAQVALTEFQREAISRVRLTLTIGGEPFVIERRGTGRAARIWSVLDGVAYTPAQWSALVLDRLGFSRVALETAAAGRRLRRPPTLSHLLLGILILSQGTIDQPLGALVPDLRMIPYRNALLDLILGLESGLLTELRRRLHRYNSRASEQRKAAARLRDLAAGDRRFGDRSPEEIHARYRELSADRDHRVREMRSIRAALDAAERRRQTTMAERDRAMGQHANAEKAVDELSDQLEALAMEIARMGRPEPDAPRRDWCDACDRPLAGLPRLPGACELCGRPDARRPRPTPPPREAYERLWAEQKSLRDQRKQWRLRRDDWERRVRDMIAEYDTANHVYIDRTQQFASASQLHTSSAEDLDALGSVHELHTRAEDHDRNRRSYEDQARQLTHAMHAEEQRMRDRHALHGALSEEYRVMLDLLDVEGNHDAEYIDVGTHDHTIAGRPVVAHGPGGTASRSRIAFSLAHAAYAHKYPEASRFPSCLMIDSPRKDQGAGRLANQRSKDLYAVFRQLGAMGLQILICDGSISEELGRGIGRTVLPHPLTSDPLSGR